MSADEAPRAARAPILPPAAFWLFVLGSLALLVVHFTFGLAGAVADGAVGPTAQRRAFGSCAVSAALPLAVVLGLLAARAATRTREHLALGAFVARGITAAMLWRGATADIERVRQQYQEGTAGPAHVQQQEPGAAAAPDFAGFAAGCRDGCPPDVSREVCERFCVCLEDQVRRADFKTAQRLLSQPDDPEVQAELSRLSMACPVPGDASATAP